MGFFTRLIAGLVAASTLGAGLAGTAGAVDTTGATGDAKGVVKLASDDTSGLPDHLVNGDFEYPGANVLSKNRYDEKASWNWWGVSRKDKMVYDSDHETQWVSLPSTFDSDRFAWDSTEVAGVQNGSSQWHTNEVELQRDSRTGNMYGELCAYQANTSIRQYIRTTPGVLYKVRLKHASLSRDYLDKMQVLIGPAGNEQPVRMTRVESQNGLDATGESTASTTVSTHASNEMEIKDGQGTPYSSRNHDGQWATYEGVYVATSDVTSFTFKSVDAKAWNLGNLLDDIVFDKAYRLSYDKNASDAAGEVPSNQRGKENTTQPARTRTSGTVRTVADDAAGRTVLECKQSGEGATGPYADNFCWIDWSNLPLSRTGEPIPVRINVPGGHIDADATITHTNNAALAAKDFIGSKWSRLTSAYKLTGNTALAFSGRMGRQDPAASVTFSNITPSADRTDTGVNVLKDFRLAFGDAEVMSGGVLQGHDVYEQTDIESDKTLEKLGMIGSGDPNQSYSKANTGYGTTHVTLAGGPKGATDDVNKDSKGSAVVGAKQASQFKVSFKQVNQHWDGWGSAIAVGVYMPYLTAYPLTYDKNASDATGEVPSNQRGKENTTQPAKAKATGTVRAVADTAANTTRPAKSETDGKVSDLVQRTTTHEDGSVTVRTIDTSTDVVSGCQVYYPAGQRITLATMAKDDDCWDSSMLSRPGHTQLGWNQDRNATQAQPEVTMVEGGMTVYAVWVGNPVLTYDTNKPSTWSGQMPSTPASVSVPYNTAAADGSGWRAGDTTKIRGYRFLGWYTGPQDNAGLYDWTRPLTGSVTVYAHWQRLQANVIYNANGGTGSHANTTGWQYSDVTIPGDTSKSFKRDGYYFKYWNTQKDGKGTTYKDSAQVPLQDKNVTLYAIWAPYNTVITETGGIGLPIAIAGGVTLLVMGIGSTVMLTRRMRGER